MSRIIPILTLEFDQILIADMKYKSYRVKTDGNCYVGSEFHATHKLSHFSRQVVASA